jgi:hypothetical protein
MLTRGSIQVSNPESIVREIESAQGGTRGSQPENLEGSGAICTLEFRNRGFLSSEVRRYGRRDHRYPSTLRVRTDSSCTNLGSEEQDDDSAFGGIGHRNGT